jgi:hypothetical protein
MPPWPVVPAWCSMSAELAPNAGVWPSRQLERNAKETLEPVQVKSASSGQARLKTLMSTLEGVFHEEHEVPRGKLVTELKQQSDLFSTQHLSKDEFFKDTLVPL